MGLDRWMLSQLCDEQPVLLRFYQWQQPTLSLGHHQSAPPNSSDLDIAVEGLSGVEFAELVQEHCRPLDHVEVSSGPFRVHRTAVF